MGESYKSKIIAVVGPTASGKTTLGIRLATALNGEIISGDSMQIYRGLDIGTAKATSEEQSTVKHWCIDIRDPDELFSVADYISYANHCIQDIISRGKTPIIVGGTGLYIESLIKGIIFSPEKQDTQIKNQLQKELMQKGSPELYRELLAVDPESAKNIHPNNSVRIIRALAHYRTTGHPLSEQKANSIPSDSPYDCLLLGLHYDSREILYQRIEKRCDLMLQAGLLAEAKKVFDNQDIYITAAKAIGYKEFFPLFNGTQNLSECTHELKKASRNYAKRQMTWFRHMEDIHWLDAGDSSEAYRKALSLCLNFLGTGNEKK